MVGEVNLINNYQNRNWLSFIPNAPIQQQNEVFNSSQLGSGSDSLYLSTRENTSEDEQVQDLSYDENGTYHAQGNKPTSQPNNRYNRQFGDLTLADNYIPLESEILYPSLDAYDNSDLPRIHELYDYEEIQAPPAKIRKNGNKQGEQDEEVQDIYVPDADESIYEMKWKEAVDAYKNGDISIEDLQKIKKQIIEAVKKEKEEMADSTLSKNQKTVLKDFIDSTDNKIFERKDFKQDPKISTAVTATQTVDEMGIVNTVKILKDGTKVEIIEDKNKEGFMGALKGQRGGWGTAIVGGAEAVAGVVIDGLLGWTGVGAVIGTGMIVDGGRRILNKDNSAAYTAIITKPDGSQQKVESNTANDFNKKLNIELGIIKNPAMVKEKPAKEKSTQVKPEKTKKTENKNTSTNINQAIENTADKSQNTTTQSSGATQVTSNNTTPAAVDTCSHVTETVQSITNNSGDVSVPEGSLVDKLGIFSGEVKKEIQFPGKDGKTETYKYYSRALNLIEYSKEENGYTTKISFHKNGIVEKKTSGGTFKDGMIGTILGNRGGADVAVGAGIETLGAIGLCFIPYVGIPLAIVAGADAIRRAYNSATKPKAHKLEVITPDGKQGAVESNDEMDLIDKRQKLYKELGLTK